MVDAGNDSKTEVMNQGEAADTVQESGPQMSFEDGPGIGDLPEWQNIKHRLPPSLIEATTALADIKNILCPRQETGNGYKDAHLDRITRTRLENMCSLLWVYTN